MINRTKDIIRETFIEMLSEMPLDRITVSGLSERCGMHRHTFYYYYDDIFSLVKDIFLLRREQFLKRARHFDTLVEAYRESTEIISENRTAVAHLYTSEHRELIKQYFLEVIGAAVEMYVNVKSEDITPDPQEKRLVIEFLTAALLGVTEYYMDKGLDEDGEKRVSRLEELFDGSVRRALERSAETKK